MWSKSCPRCVDGDLILETEPDAWSVSCLQCGYTKDVEDPIKVVLAVENSAPNRGPVGGLAL